MDNNFFEDLMKKYWEGETSVEEERMIKNYLKDDNDPANKELKTMFTFYSDEKKIQYHGELKAHNTKVIKINLIKKIAVAASIILIFGLGIYFWTNKQSINQTAFSSNNINNPEEALEITKEALAFLAFNYNKGEESITGTISNLEKLDIIKSD